MTPIQDKSTCPPYRPSTRNERTERVARESYEFCRETCIIGTNEMIRAKLQNAALRDRLTRTEEVLATHFREGI